MLWYGKKDGYPFLDASYISPAQNEFVEVGWEKKIRPWGLLDGSTTEIKRKLKERIATEELKIGMVAAVPIPPRVVLEVSLTQSGSRCLSQPWKSTCPVISVFKYVSPDGGMTWHDPVIAADAEIFELGRSVHDQSFIARPIRINGKAVQPDFPPPPK